MYAFKFVYVSAIFLLALVQGVVSQDIEPVPLGGSCETILGPVCIETMRIFMLLTIHYSIFNRNLVSQG
ncbi:hypothetical protein DFH09DRAFT_1159435 [Mycena vulgaris]|nr:hypothetical protein DFH09DRAFT_1159435 [Mycena vulgaris]